MSILDDIKSKVSGLFTGGADKVTEGADTVREVAEKATSGSLGDKVEGGVQQAKDGVEKAKDALSGS
jgi:hypothetical protein